MAKHVGIKLPEDLLAVLNKGQTVAILATFSEKGLPNTTPVQCIAAKGLESILMTIDKDHTGYHNMVWQKKLCFVFLMKETLRIAYWEEQALLELLLLCTLL